MNATKKRPKVLVVSTSVFSEKSNNGKTLSSFFDGYGADNLCQLAFAMAPTNDEVCNNYFCITFSDAIKGKQGRSFKSYQPELSASEVSTRSSAYRIFHRFSERRWPFSVFVKNWIRERADFSAVWKHVDEFGPEVVFFQGFDMPFAYEIALNVCEKYNAPLILELTDDYTASLHKYSLFDKINKKKYLTLFAKAIQKARLVLDISPKMKAEYEKRFGGVHLEMMNSVEIDESVVTTPRNQNDFVYAGNVGLGRWKVLVKFAEALGEIDPNARLSVYTPNVPDEAALKAFAKRPALNYGGSLSPDELRERLSVAGNVVHVESFDKKNRVITRLSISTKIPEYMASGATIYAIGPDDVASVEYLRDLKAAVCVASDKLDDIRKAIAESRRPDFDRDALVRNALDACATYHDKKKNAATIKKAIEESVRK